MEAQETLPAIPRTELSQPVPELPVRDVERARRYYCEKMGFEPGWIEPGSEIGSVKRDRVVIFMRRRPASFEPAVHWVFAPRITETHDEMRTRGALITEPLEKKPWGLTQFTVEDLDGHRFYFHCD
ncbi:MAG TPA: VOC family protein [Steroidobacteraceae bacterium]|jgi:catechol 2,3-dioxygenase-like lactoylglutathione lyase family enzyme